MESTEADAVWLMASIAAPATAAMTPAVEEKDAQRDPRLPRAASDAERAIVIG
jgi:hypothetical protein